MLEQVSFVLFEQFTVTYIFEHFLNEHFFMTFLDMHFWFLCAKRNAFCFTVLFA